jgi:hypothetical protein
LNHPYRSAPDRAFWKKAIAGGWNADDFPQAGLLIRKGERVASAGSCFAANIVPFIERAGFAYVRTEPLPVALAALGQDNFSYSKFSAAYGNIYTVRQAVQLIKRALGRFAPVENCWATGDVFVDPFRPGLKYPASTQHEFRLLTERHLSSVLDAIRKADVFVFTLGLTEAWLSTTDGAVFPACPGTVAGSFDSNRHAFHNFTAPEVIQDLDEFVRLVREINARIRLILTVSPVPLVATATGQHVLLATVYSKSVLRVAAETASQNHRDVTYFPAYEIVSGPQAPEHFFEPDRREPSKAAIGHVMRALLSRCETDAAFSEEAAGLQSLQTRAAPAVRDVAPLPAVELEDHARRLSAVVASAECEEAAAGVPDQMHARS